MVMGHLKSNLDAVDSNLDASASCNIESVGAMSAMSALRMRRHCRVGVAQLWRVGDDGGGGSGSGGSSNTTINNNGSGDDGGGGDGDSATMTMTATMETKTTVAATTTTATATKTRARSKRSIVSEQSTSSALRRLWSTKAPQ